MAYRTYLIRQAIGGDFFVSKDGHHITTQSTLAAAKAAIDSLLN